MRLHWIGVAHKLGRDDAIEKFLSATPDISGASPENRMIVAHVFDQYGFAKEALELAYETLRHNRDTPNVHLAYFDLIFRGRAGKALVPEVNEIGIDTAFTVRALDGHEHTYVIIDVPDASVARGEIRPTDPLAQRALGLRAGDSLEVALGRTPADIRKIVRIKHKLVEALHGGLESFESMFPGYSSFERVTFKDPQSGIDPLLRKVREKNEWVSDVVQEYKKHSYPLGALSTALGGTQISAYHGVLEAGEQIRVCIGAHDERLVGLRNILGAKSGCVVDP